MEFAFYNRSGGAYEATELTRGPWDPEAQHAGPPAALIGREIEAVPAEAPMQVGRITFEILGPIPIAPLRVQAEVIRPGRSVELIAASLRAGETELIRASAWRLRMTDVELPVGLERPEAMPGPGNASPQEFFPTGAPVGYHTAMEYRFLSGAFLEAGPARVWMRMRHPLVAGEAPSPLQRLLVVADSGNGVSAALDWQRYLFINVDLSVHLHRMPAGEWVGMDAITIPEETGIGISDSRLYDERGPIGRAAQTLLVDHRS